MTVRLAQNYGGYFGIAAHSPKKQIMANNPRVKKFKNQSQPRRFQVKGQPGANKNPQLQTAWSDEEGCSVIPSDSGESAWDKFGGAHYL